MQEGHEHKVTFNVYRVLGQPCVTFYSVGALKRCTVRALIYKGHTSTIPLILWSCATISTFH